MELLPLLPSILAIVLAITTRRVIFSLAVSVFSGSLILHSGFNIAAIASFFDVFARIFVDSGEIKSENLGLMFFLWLLGILVYLMEHSGGIDAFAQKAANHVSGKIKTQFFIMMLGILIFIDDYFNCLAVGSVSRKITDREGISRAKLAHILDSTAGPVCIIAPISSWGASIIVILDTIIGQLNIPGESGFSLFISSIPYNFYAFLTLIVLLCSIFSGLDFPLMRKLNKRAEQGIAKEKIFLDKSSKEHFEVTEGAKNGSWSAVVPVLALTIGTIFAMLVTGHMNSSESSFSILAALENVQIGVSLVWGALVGLGFALRYEFKRKNLREHLSSSAIHGFKAMAPAMITLCFAWALANVISDLKAGQFIADWLRTKEIPMFLLPFAFFVICSLTSFSTGTSWATFAIYLPMACEIAVANSELGMLQLLIGATLGGAVFGDHSSPLSDTSILSSSGAACDHLDHVMSQLPYCLLSGGIAGLLYLVVPSAGLATLVVSFVVGSAVLYALKQIKNSTRDQIISYND